MAACCFGRSVKGSDEDFFATVAHALTPDSEETADDAMDGFLMCGRRCVKPWPSS